MIFTCTYSNGNVGFAQELQRYLIRKKQDFLLLLHPLDLSIARVSVLEEYKNGQLVRSQKSWPSPNINAVNYFRCVCTTFWSLLRFGRRTQLFIAVSNIDAVVGLFLRLLFKFKVVLVSTDFSPHRRFANPIMNTVYNVCDRVAYRACNAVWHMYPERGALKRYKNRAPSYDILDGNNFRRVKRLALAEINRFRLVYIGQINRDCRLDEAIEAIADLKSDFPEAGLDIISSGDPMYEQRLRKLASDRGVSERVAFHGQIPSPDRYEPILAKAGIGLCLYEIDKNDFAWYGTPLKVYLYAACGLPTVCSDTMGPFTREYIERDGVGVLSARGTLKAILMKLFSDASDYARMREKTIHWAAEFDYDDKFDKYLSLV